MSARRHLTACSIGLAIAAWIGAAYLGCAASNTDDAGRGGSGATAGGATGGGSTSTGTGGTNSSSGTGGSGGLVISTGGTMDDGGVDPDAACAKFSAEAELAPAAMLIVLDMTASMTGSKWSSSQLAIVSAIDKDVFDSMSLGLVTFPAQYVNPPQCLCTAIGFPNPQQCAQWWPVLTGTPGVSCGVSALPQVAIAVAGPEKSNAGFGVRSNIYDYLVGHTPISTADDGSPTYEALLAAYNALGVLSGVEERIAVLITDGGFSCTSLSNPARGAYTDANGCDDWEHPDNINQLISAQRTDPTNPVRTMVVGVPGSNSTGQQVGGFDTPPYNMLLALSTYAVSGSPDTVDPGCDSGAVFTQNGGAPVVPCHIDLSNGQQFDADALANAISQIRGDVLGCVYPMPEPPPNETIDENLVNVEVTVDGVTEAIPRRSDPNDDCAVDGCWDYDQDGNVVILGETCEGISNANQAKVEILVGCTTVLK